MIIIDAEGAERTWIWVVEKYNLPHIVGASRDKDHWEVVELHENCRDSSMTVRLVGDNINNIPITFCWRDEKGHIQAVRQKTDTNGQTGFGMGGGAYYHPPDAGPHWVYVGTEFDSDTVRGLGMLGKRDHWHLEPTFRFVKGETEPPPPPDCEEYRIAINKIRDIVKAFPPLVD